MICKEFDITTLDLSPKICPNFKPVSLEDVLKRYQDSVEVHLFIEQPHLDENGNRVCNIYDCAYPRYLQHYNFVDIAISSSKKIKRIMQEVENDKLELKQNISSRTVRKYDNIISNISCPVEALVNACGLVRVFQYLHPMSSEVCEIQFPLKGLYGKELQPEQYDILRSLYYNNVIKDDYALGYAEHTHAKLKRDYEEFMKDVRGLTR